MANKKKKKVVKKNNLSKKGNNRKKKKLKKKNNAKVNSNKKRNGVKTNTSKSISTKSKNVKRVNSKDKKENLNKSVNKRIAVKNENSNKIKVNVKWILIVFLFLLVSLCLLFIYFIDKTNSNKVNISFINIDFEEYLELYKSEELEFVYLYHNSCVNCDDYEVNLSKLESQFEIKLKKFDYSGLSDNELSALKTSNTALLDGIDIPMLISIKDGDEINSISGIKEYKALENFISSSKNPMDVKSFNKIHVEDYLSLLNSKNKSIIYICSHSNSGCEKFTPILEKVANSRKVKVNYLNTDSINTSEDWDKLENSSKIYDDVWFMPAILIVKDGKIIDYKMESLSEKDLNKFLKKNGL